MKLTKIKKKLGEYKYIFVALFLFYSKFSELKYSVTLLTLKLPAVYTAL